MAFQDVPLIKLNDSLSIPSIGFGTYQIASSDIDKAIGAALKSGYRHFDCAHLYENEVAIGNALKKQFASKEISRGDLFITSKLWNTFHRPELVKVGLETTLKNLQLEYVDLYLVHWPVPYEPSDQDHPRDEHGNVLYDYTTNLQKTWKAMEALVEAGLCRSIGVSNFNQDQIERVLAFCSIKPLVLQVETNTHFPNQSLIDFAHNKEIVVEAFAPLASPYRHVDGQGVCLLEEPFVQEIGKNHGKTPAQVVLRHAIQRGLIVIPKSATPSRIAENLQIFDFELTDAEMKTLGSLGTHERQVKAAVMAGHPEFPF